MEDKKNNMKPKMIEVTVAKAGASDNMSPDRLKIKHDLLNKVKSLALKSMKDQMSDTEDLDKEMDCEMDKAPSIKPIKMGDMEEMAEESEEEQEENILPENPGDSKKEKLASLMKEMEDLTARVKMMLEA